MEAEKKRIIKAALVGNPNSGKTTIFNNLTGSHQHVGNYGGVTVEVKEGGFEWEGHRVHVVDLPGMYSLTAYSVEEGVARDYLLKEKPDVVVNVVDGSNLERNLFLTIQLRELGLPLVLVLNMSDEVKKKGFEVDRSVLSDNVGGPVVSTVGTHNLGTSRVKDRIFETAEGQWSGLDVPGVYYGEDVEREVEKITRMLREALSAGERSDIVSLRWISLKLLENDTEVHHYLPGGESKREILEQVQSSRQRLSRVYGEEAEMVIAEQRYGAAHGLCRAVLRQTADGRMDWTEKADRVLTHRALGLPVFAGLMYLTFWMVFTLGEYPMGWLEAGFGWLGKTVQQVWPGGTNSLLCSLFVDGIIGGVGGVIVFLPNIMLLFLAISILEDTGYMARAAFLMDRVMKWVGLHGKSFIPMLIGFGCTVPAIMGSRVLEKRQDRLTTIMILPLISCGARLTIYMLLIPAFFSGRTAALVMYAVYVIGILLAIAGAKLLRLTVFRGEPSPFVMELPPYRIPTFKAIGLHVWHRSWLYLRKAGTVILGISILMWAMLTFPRLPAEREAGISGEEAGEARLEYSLAGRIGRGIEPILRPLGFDWKIGTALIGSFAAKEVFVAQMGIVHAVAEEEQEKPEQLRQTLREHYRPLTGFCIMLFCLIASPCMATVAVVRREAGGWKWAIAQFAGLTAAGYIITLLVFQIGNMISL